MRLLLSILGVLTAVVCIEKPAPRCSARMANFSRLTGDNPPRRFCLLSGAVPGPSPFSSVAVAVPIFSGDLMII